MGQAFTTTSTSPHSVDPAALLHESTYRSSLSSLHSSALNGCQSACLPPPRAGKLAFRPSSDNIVVDCNPSAVPSGLKFVEAEFSNGRRRRMRRLVDEHDIEAFVLLVPVREGDSRQIINLEYTPRNLAKYVFCICIV